MDKLLNCPFCGSEAQKMKGVAAGYGPFYGCLNVHCGTYGRYHTLEQWNRRAPSAVEKELRGMVDALARQANEEERLKVYNAELVMGRDDAIKELRDFLRDVLFAALIGPELRNRASALLAKKQ